MEGLERDLHITELIGQGEQLGAVGNYEEAILKLEEAEKMDPENIKIYVDKSIVYMFAKKYDLATEQINKAIILDDKCGMLYFQLGNISFYQEDYETAKRNYAKGIELGHTTKIAYYQMATLYTILKDYDSSLYYYNKTLQVDPNYVRALLKKIEILLYTKKTNEAYVAACNLIDRRPDCFEGYHYKFMSLMSMKKIEDAKIVLDNAIERFPNDMGLKYDLIMYYDSVGRFNEAIEVIETYFETNLEKYRRVKADKARLLYKARNFSQAEKTALELLETNYTSEMAYYVMLSRLSEADYDNAIIYAQLIKNNKDKSAAEPYYAALYYEALAYLKSGRMELANQSFEFALSELRIGSIKEPGRVNIYVFRALSYKALGDNDKALEMVDYLINVTKGTFIEAYYIRAMIYQDLGESEKAKNDMDKVRASNSILQNYLM